MSKPRSHVDNLALSSLVDVPASFMKPAVRKWCKRRISRQERHAANHFLRELCAAQDLVQAAHADRYFGLEPGIPGSRLRSDATSSTALSTHCLCRSK